MGGLNLPQIGQSAGAVEYADCTSAGGLDAPNECSDMTLNNLIVRFH